MSVFTVRSNDASAQQVDSLPIPAAAATAAERDGA